MSLRRPSTPTKQQLKMRCWGGNKWILKILPIGLGLVYGFLLVVARRRMTIRFHLDNVPPLITVSRESFYQGRGRQSAPSNMSHSAHDMGNLWDDSSLIPQWMKDYFSWHKQQRALITPDNWSNFSYLIMQCAYFDQRCGGAADRLKPAPMMILLASKMKRLLMIHWQKPARLEEFLLPPKGGLDWRIPDFLIPHIATSESPLRVPQRMMRKVNATNVTIHVRYQSFNSGEEFFNTNKPYGSNFTEIYHDVWKVMFTPNPVIANMVHDLMDLWQLKPYEYVSIHLRAHYGVEFQRRDNDYIEEWTPNSLNCASQLVPGGPFFFASDSNYANLLARQYGRKQNVNVYTRTSAKEEPLHLDKVPDWQRRPPSDYYDTFVDLYLLALAKCVTYSMGGFGSWALMISKTTSCWIRHHTAPGITPCEWNSERPSALSSAKTNRSLFFPPVDGAYANNRQMMIPDPNDSNITDEFPVNYQPSVKWQDSTVLPPWMKEYLAWHKEQRAKLDSNNWKDFKYLIVQCANTDPKCGGTADRLKPIPFLVLAAYLGDRILFIRWDSPKLLEEFLMPPEGGLDWRMPDFLVPRIGSVEYPITAGKRLLRSITDYRSKVALHARIQTNHGGAEYFDDARPKGSPDYNTIFHEAWRVLFTPVPRIAYHVQTFMSEVGLFPGHYAAAHARLFYVQSSRRRFRIRSLTQNALNCASKLYPGAPIFFASDSQEAKDDAWSYGELKHTKIVARNQSSSHVGSPLHLDREGAWEYAGPNTSLSFAAIASKVSDQQRNTTAYDDTFVDLYLLAMSRCVAYNKGGFGHWGLLMCYNSSCAFRHQYNANVYKCNWTEGAESSPIQPTPQKLPPLFVRPMQKLVVVTKGGLEVASS